MQDASYLRSQAELCLHIARALSDYEAAENLRAVAAQYFVRALEAERQLATAESNFVLAPRMEISHGALFLQGQLPRHQRERRSR